MPADPTAALRFHDFELQPLERRLLVHGAPVVVGARAFDLLLALAEHPGQLLTKDSLLDRVWPGLVVEENNLAVHVSQLRKLIGVDAITTIPGRGYRFTARRLGTSPAPPAVAAPPHAPGVVPQPFTPLIGREADLDLLDALVVAGRLVTVVGSGGMGKSRLAQALAQRRASAQRHGVCWVALAEVGPGPALADAMTAALGLAGTGGAPALAAALAPLDVLLVLDGAEARLAEVAALLPGLLIAAPGLRLVVTSQAPLDLPGEQLLRLGPLALPAAPVSAEQALTFGAVALFVDRARAAGARWVLDADNTDATVALCRSLDGLPLALELAAARVPTLGVHALARAVHDRLALLTHNRNRQAPPRQQTLRAALEWSHGLLGEAERVVFRRLAVVSGSAALGMVLALADEPEGGLDPVAVLEALQTLVDRSLVALCEDGDTPRYGLLGSPRALALERLREAGEEPALRRRHAQAVAAVFDAEYDDYYSGHGRWDDWSAGLAADLGNAREALAWALDAGQTLLALQIGPTLQRALPPARVAERAALAAAMQARADAAVPARLRWRVWFQLATWWGDAQRALSHRATERVLALARALPADPEQRFTLCLSLCARARSAARVGDLALAADALAEASALEAPDWPPQRLYWIVETRYFLANARGDAAAALQALRRALVLQQAAGSDDAVMRANLVDAELAHGDADAAVRSGQALLAQLEGSRLERDLAFLRVNLLAALLVAGRVAEARDLAQRGWAQGRRFDLQPYWADHLSLLAAPQGRPDDAARLVGFADAAYRRRGEQRVGNEAAASARALGAARQALGADAVAGLLADGGQRHEHEVEALAFGAGDRPASG